jgi:hypothetical protein
MPRKDRKRYSEDLAQFVVLANLLDDLRPTDRVLPFPGDILATSRESEFLHELFTAAALALPSDEEVDPLSLAQALMRLSRLVPQLSTDGGRYGPWRTIKYIAGGQENRMTRAEPPYASIRSGDEKYVLATPEAVYRIAFAAWTSLRAIPLLANLGEGEIGLQTPAVYSIDSDGRLRRQPDPVSDVLARALDGADARRIRRCPICLKIFLANRRDKGACSDRCLNANRQKKWRSEHGEMGQYAATRTTVRDFSELVDFEKRATNIRGDKSRRTKADARTTRSRKKSKRT